MIDPGSWGITLDNANRPSDYGAVIVGRSADVIAQWYGDHTNNFFVRGGNPPVAGGGGVWNSWRKLLHDGNYTSFNGIIRALGYPSAGNDWNALGNDYSNSVIKVDPSNFSGTANGPVAAASYLYGTLLNLQTNSSSQAQIYISHAGDDLIFRGGWNNNSWQRWNKVLTNQNFSSYALPLTGGTISSGGSYPLQLQTTQRYGLRVYNSSVAGLGWWLANDANTLVFHADSSGDKASLNTDGIFTTTGSFRAPIFYDNNDTAYYLDPNSTGTSLNLAGYAYIAKGIVSGQYLTLNHDQLWAQGDLHFQYSSSGNINMNYGGGYTYSHTSLRAPIFYDYNDTGYYVDPNSTSDSALRMRGGALFGPNVTWGAYLLVGGDSRNNYINSGYASVCTSNGNLHLDSGSGYSTYINFYDGVDLIVGAGDSSTVRFKVYGNDNYSYATGSMRSPIFYDSDDTGYYINPNGNSRLARLDTDELYNFGWFRNHNINTGFYNQATSTHFYSNGSASWGITGSGGNVELQFRSNHQSTIRGYVYGDTSSNFGLLNQNGSWKVRVNGGETEIYDTAYLNDMRAYIMYDRSDTAYYVDPNATSYLNVINTAGSISQQGNQVLHAGNWTNYIQPTYAGWDSYPGKDANTVSGGSWARSYFTYSNNAPATGAFVHFPADGYDLQLNSTYGSSEGFYFRTRNGDTGAFNSWRRVLVQDAWQDNKYFNSQGDISATVFYDSNNSAYYADPSATSNLYDLQLSGAKHTYLYLTPGNNYEAMIRYNGGSGSTWYVGKRVTSQLVGTESFHFYSQAAGQTVGGIDTSGNMMASGSHRAPIFYDSDNTEYYCNPWGTSNFVSLVLSGSTYFRPNSWIQFDGSYGLYWPNNNGAHLHANDLSTYTQLAIRGNRNGFSGIFDQYSAVNGFMYDSAGNGGVYREAQGRWYQYHDVGNNCTAFGTSVTNSAYNIYAPKGIYSGGRVDGTIFYDSNNTGYYADLNSTTYLYYLQSATTIRSDSDRRLKENIVPITGALAKVRLLQGCTYTRNDLADKTKVYMGMIAQDVLPIVPEVVSGSEEGKYSLGYAELVPLLNEAIKEQDLIIQTQEARIKRLESLIEKLI
jgi:hypothetical protein